MPDEPAPARTPEAVTQSLPAGHTVPPGQENPTADGILGTPPRSSSGSGDSPFIPADPAVEGQQPGSSGSASVPRSGVEGPERQAADDEPLQPDHDRAPQSSDAAPQGVPSVPLPGFRPGLSVSSSPVGETIPTVEHPEGRPVQDHQAWYAYNEQLRQSCAEMWSRLSTMETHVARTNQQLLEEQTRTARIENEYKQRLDTLSLEKSEQHDSLMSVESKLAQVTEHNQRMQSEVIVLRRSTVAFFRCGY